MQEEQNNKRERMQDRRDNAFQGDGIVRKSAGSLQTKLNVYL